ncbi:MAG: 7TM diverse intracellular signaling domain-containing protein, partial [Bacteroidota bacterium]
MLSISESIHAQDSKIIQGEYSLSEIKQSDNWSSISTKPYDGNSTYWLKVLFPEDIPTNGYGYLFDVGLNIDEATLFFPDGTQQHNGRLVPKFKKEVFTHLPKAIFRLPSSPQKGEVFYIRVEERSGMDVVIKPTLTDFIAWEEAYEKEQRLRYTTQGVFQGAVWLMVIYSLLVFVIHRDTAYLYYALYLIGMSTFSWQATGFA